MRLLSGGRRSRAESYGVAAKRSDTVEWLRPDERAQERDACRLEMVGTVRREFKSSMAVFKYSIVVFKYSMAVFKSSMAVLPALPEITRLQAKRPENLPV